MGEAIIRGQNLSNKGVKTTIVPVYNNVIRTYAVENGSSEHLP